MALKRGYSGVTGYTGMPGSGKTYALAEVAYRAEKRGIPVWCNQGFDLKACVEAGRIFSSFEDFLAIPNGSVVVWDELPVYVNSRKWQEFPDGLLYRLTQVRKASLELHYSAIDEMMIDTTVRRLTFWYWSCRQVVPRLSGRWLTRSLWPPSQYRKKDARPYRRERLWVNEKIAATYDTMATVAAPLAQRTARDAQRWEKLDTGSAGRPAVRLQPAAAGGDLAAMNDDVAPAWGAWRPAGD